MKRHLFPILFLLALCCAGTTHAVTLAQPRIMSFLGQPLELEIDLIGLEPGQQRHLNTGIAAEQHLTRLGMSRGDILDALTFDVAQSDGKWVVRARTERAVAEPYIEFPLQISWPGGQLVQKYTLLLEPFTGATDAPMARYDDNYGPVRHGEILTAIAQKLKPSGITTWQMSIVIYRANLHAFTDGNINELRVGSILTIPPLEVIEKLDNPSAIAAFAAETTRWLAPGTISPHVAKVSKKETINLPPATDAREKTPLHRERDAQLPVVPDNSETDSIAADQPSLPGQPAASMESAVSHPVSSDVIEARLAAAESKLAHVRRLLEFKHAQIEAMQTENAALRVIQATRKAESSAPGASTANSTTLDRPPAQASQAAAITVQHDRTFPAGTLETAPIPWYERYVWGAWVMFGLAALSTLLIWRRRPESAPESAYFGGLAEDSRHGRRSTPEIQQAPSKAQSDEVRWNPDRPRVHPAHGLIEIEEIPPDFPKLAEFDFPVYSNSGETCPNTDDDALRDAQPGSEHNPQTGPGHTTEATSGVAEVELAAWAAELVENAEQVDDAAQAKGQAAQFDTIELVDDLPDELELPDLPEQPEQPNRTDNAPLSLDEDFPGVPAESDTEFSAEVPELDPIPLPIELLSVDETHKQTRSSDQDDLGVLAAEGKDFSLSIQLARAYIEIGDPECAKDILKRALDGAPDPDPRTQMEALLTRIG